MRNDAVETAVARGKEYPRKLVNWHDQGAFNGNVSLQWACHGICGKVEQTWGCKLLESGGRPLQGAAQPWSRETLQAAISPTEAEWCRGSCSEIKQKFNDSSNEHSSKSSRVRKHQLDGEQWRELS